MSDSNASRITNAHNPKKLEPPLSRHDSRARETLPEADDITAKTHTLPILNSRNTQDPKPHPNVAQYQPKPTFQGPLGGRANTRGLAIISSRNSQDAKLHLNMANPERRQQGLSGSRSDARSSLTINSRNTHDLNPRLSMAQPQPKQSNQGQFDNRRDTRTPLSENSRNTNNTHLLPNTARSQPKETKHQPTGNPSDNKASATTNNNNLNTASPTPPADTPHSHQQDPQEQQPPATSFDTSFSTTLPLYFHHIITPSTATLRVLVLGANLHFSFHHSSAPALFSPQTILTALTKKTVGFLCLAASPQREILAWSESGHGHGPRGDCLDTAPATLPNAIWTSRALHLSHLLGLPMGHPFDRGQPGMFRASHVEIKLATHAVHVLLRMYGITSSPAITTSHLAALRQHKPPPFEVYFSKRNCSACAAWVARLHRLTGVNITLLWKDRLVHIEYAKTTMGCAPVPDVVDLTAAAEGEAAFATPQPLGSYINGLAYCVGQMASAPATVTSAIVGLANVSRRQALRRRMVQRNPARRQRICLDGPPGGRSRCPSQVVLVDECEVRGDLARSGVRRRRAGEARVQPPRQVIHVL